MIQTGSYQLDLMYKPNREQLHFRWDEYDPKSLEFVVAFATSFPSPPFVLLSLTELQTDSSLASEKGSTGEPCTNLAVSPGTITAIDFTINLTVGRNNSIGKLSVSWLAITN